MRVNHGESWNQVLYALDKGFDESFVGESIRRKKERMGIEPLFTGIWKLGLWITNNLSLCTSTVAKGFPTFLTRARKVGFSSQSKPTISYTYYCAWVYLWCFRTHLKWQLRTHLKRHLRDSLQVTLEGITPSYTWWDLPKFCSMDSPQGKI